MSPADTERKLHQLDGDVQAIYEMIGAMDGTLRRQHNRLEEISAHVTRLDEKVDALDEKVSTLDEKVSTLDEKVSTLDEKMDRVLGLLGDRGAV